VGELEGFDEIGACGTAVVLTPISSITYGENVYKYSEECGDVSKKLYDRMTAIQYGEYEDKHGWLLEV
jgi:branched-chain amino acid aminotransferase